jgi:selenocysteine lyase/cysteine desulfurase
MHSLLTAAQLGAQSNATDRKSAMPAAWVAASAEIVDRIDDPSSLEALYAYAERAYQATGDYERPLTQQWTDELRRISGVQVIGITSADRFDERVPTVSITHPHHRSSALAKALAAQGINVWSAHNYAYELAKYLGLDEREGVLRIGLAHYNTAAEVERIVHSPRGLPV